MEKLKVSKNFSEGLLRMFPHPQYRFGSWVVEEDPKAKDHFLVVWDIDAPIPTQEEIEAAIQGSVEPDEATKLQLRVEALSARVAELENK